MNHNHETKTVDLSDVIGANGKAFILINHRCGLCGMKSGMKMKCAEGRCHAYGEKNKPYFFHVSCAKQAGLRVSHNEYCGTDNDFTGKRIRKGETDAFRIGCVDDVICFYLNTHLLQKLIFFCS